MQYAEVAQKMCVHGSLLRGEYEEELLFLGKVSFSSCSPRTQGGLGG
jgi:hypothetical protein